MENFDQFNPQIYEEIKSLLPRNSTENIKFEPEIFSKAVQLAKTEADVEFLLTVVAEYMGNYRPLSGNLLDEYLAKAIELGCPNKLSSLLGRHRAMMYYPNPNLIEKIFTIYNENKNWAAIKEIYNVVGRKYYIKKSNLIYDIVIQNAFVNKSNKDAINAYLDILDYEQIKLQKETLINLIYSNQELFLKDSIFVQLLEKTLKASNVESVGTVLPLLVFYHSNKNQEMTQLNLEKLIRLGKVNQSNSVEVYEAKFILDFLTNISTEDSELAKTVKEIINTLPENIFDPTYNELLGNLRL